MPPAPAPLDAFHGVGFSAGGSIKGNLLRARPRYVDKHWGRDGLDRLCAALPPALAHAMRSPPTLTSWLPHADLVAVDRAIWQGPMEGDVATMRAFGAEIAAYDLPNVYQAVLRILTSPEFLLRRAGTVFALYFRECGTLSGEATDGAGHLVHTGFLLPRYMCRFGIAGWLVGMLDVYRALDIEVEHSRCRHDRDDRCEWRVVWR